jgi:hypothetical protein
MLKELKKIKGLSNVRTYFVVSRENKLNRIVRTYYGNFDIRSFARGEISI